MADTRARDLLILPRYLPEPAGQCWSKVCRARGDELPSFGLTRLDPAMPAREEDAPCRQREGDFLEDAAAIAKAHRQLRRRTPSRHDHGVELDTDWGVVGPGEEPLAPVLDIKGGRRRGLVLHKLMEELLTGELEEVDLEARAGTLIAELQGAGKVVAQEVSDTVRRTLALPEVAGLRPRLIAEADVTSVFEGAEEAELVTGVADAVAINADGKVDVVIDWKSDVAPDEGTLRLYRGQIRDYLTAVHAPRGLIVLMTQGRVLEVLSGPEKAAAKPDLAAALAEGTMASRR